MRYIERNISELIGKTLVRIEGEVGDEEIIFTTSENEYYSLIYIHDCCAHCSIEDICGDLEDLLNTPILIAREESNKDSINTELEEQDASYTWTFYKLDTAKGGVTIRWFGSSNGYYSEQATFEKLVDGTWQSYIKVGE